MRRRQLRREADPAEPARPRLAVPDERHTREPRGVADQRSNLFIIPYQALKGSTGGDPQETVPILEFASFYVMNWTGSNVTRATIARTRRSTPTATGPPPRSRSPTLAGAMTGVFVKTVDYESGPVDTTSTCLPDQLGQCRASLVR